PKEALTLGINTILSAKKIYLLAWGLEKASIIKNTLKGKVNSDIPSTYLQNHNNVSFILDKDAASKILISD
ncbi:MAG: 6-phosphogluconolactonase, partial [Alphaproteobacteria bacterium]|nr:6-phosphogluconolactonase [Alphaproteobacteria bacterium]